MKRYFGCHVSSAGGLPNALINGEALNVSAIQMHPTPPQRWNLKPFDPKIAEQFATARATSPIKKVFFHGIYLINLASKDRRLTTQAESSLLYYLELNALVGGDGVIFHVGSNRDQEDEKAGVEQASRIINNVLSKSKAEASLLLEVAAGSGKVIGDRFEELAEIYQLVEDKKRVGFALDTQHMWASGYDIVGDLTAVVKQIEQSFTIEKTKIIHLNDSKSELGSRVDRHENLGMGKIGIKPLEKFINHSKLKNIPVVLETPGLKEEATAKKEVEELRRMVSGQELG